MNQVEKRLFQDAIAEIKGLRENNHLMGLRLKMFDDVMSIFRARETGGGMCMAEDVVYKIEKAIEADNLEKDPQPKVIRTARQMDEE